MLPKYVKRILCIFKNLFIILFPWNVLTHWFFPSGGVFANLILEEFEKKMSNNNNQNVLQLLCAQEIIVATAISALTNSKTSICDRTIDIGVVKHGTALIAELHKKNNEYYVKVSVGKIISH